VPTTSPNEERISIEEQRAWTWEAGIAKEVEAVDLVDHRERGADSMTRAELIALASPPCHECAAPVERVEIRWHLDEDLRWRPGPFFMVCHNEHRVLVVPLA
jgi:hypothetical protein